MGSFGKIGNFPSNQSLSIKEGKLVTLTSDGVGSKFCRVDRQQTLRLITNTDRDRSDTDTTIIETSNQTVNDGLLIALRQRVDGSFIMNKHFSREPP